MGNMASAILLGAVKSGFLKGEDTIAYDTNAFKLDKLNRECGMAKAGSTQEVIENSEIILLAIKPKIVEGVLSGARKRSRARRSWSIAAGWQYSRLRRLVDSSTHICAIMPQHSGNGWGRHDHHRGDKRADPERTVFTRKLFKSLGEDRELSQ